MLRYDHNASRLPDEPAKPRREQAALGGLGLFTLASLARGFAPTALVLIIARLVQGAGAALMIPPVLSGIQLTFVGSVRTLAIGLYAVVLSGGVVAGQVLGGVLISANLFGST